MYFIEIEVIIDLTDVFIYYENACMLGTFKPLHIMQLSSHSMTWWFIYLSVLCWRLVHICLFIWHNSRTNERLQNSSFDSRDWRMRAINGPWLCLFLLMLLWTVFCELSIPPLDMRKQSNSMTKSITFCFWLCFWWIALIIQCINSFGKDGGKSTVKTSWTKWKWFFFLIQTRI